MTVGEANAISLNAVIVIVELVSNSQPDGKEIIWTPTAISPFSVPKLGPVNDLNVLHEVPAQSSCEVVSIEILVPPVAGLTVAAAKAELGATKKPPNATARTSSNENDLPSKPPPPQPFSLFYLLKLLGFSLCSIYKTDKSYRHKHTDNLGIVKLIHR